MYNISVYICQNSKISKIVSIFQNSLNYNLKIDAFIEVNFMSIKLEKGGKKPTKANDSALFHEVFVRSTKGL